MKLSKFWITAYLLCSTALGAVWSEPQRILFGKASGIALDTQGVLWCVAYPEGLYKYHNETSTWQLEIDVLPFGGTPCFDKDSILWLIQYYGGGHIRYVRYDGESWSEEEYIPTYPSSSFPPRITADSAEGVWVGYSTGWFGFQAVAYNRYQNGTWSEPQVITNTSEAIENVISSITTDAYGRVWIGWVGVEDLYDSIVHYIKVAYCDGENWSEEMTIAVWSGYSCGGPRLASDRGGGMWAVWSYQKEDSGPVEVLASHWEGEMWTDSETIAIGNVGGRQIAVDADGNAWAAWSQAVESDSSGDIYYSVNQGQGWSEPAPVNEHPAADGSASITVDGEGRIWCIWGSFREGEHGVYASYATGVGVEEEGPAAHYPSFTIDKSVGREFTFRVSSPDVRGELLIYDAGGRKVRSLAVEGRTVAWDGKGQYEKSLPSGVYFVKPDSNPSEVRKVVLIR